MFLFIFLFRYISLVVFLVYSLSFTGVTGEHVDQFANTGHQASSFTARRLGYQEGGFNQSHSEEGNLAASEQIFSTLLRHVGLSCSHSLAMEHAMDSMMNKECIFLK